LAKRPFSFLRIFWWVLLLLFILPLFAIGLVWFKKDTLIAMALAAANEQLATPVRVDKIELKWWSTFPQVAVQLDSVIVQESCGGHKRRLASIGQVRLGFSIVDVWQGRYRIQYVSLKGGRIRLRHLANGTVNYAILKPTPADSSSQKKAFQLKAVQATDLQVIYQDESTDGVQLSVQLPQASAQLLSVGELTRCHIKAQNALLHSFTIGHQAYAHALPININQTVEIENQKHVRFLPGTLSLGKAAFTSYGEIGLGASQGSYRFQLQNKGSSLATLAILLPEAARKAMAQYKTHGQVYFSATITGFAAKASPAIVARFGARQASFSHKAYKQAVFKNVSFSGTFSMPAGKGLAGANMLLQNVQGNVAGNPFSARLQLTNLASPSITGFAKGRLPLALFAAELQKSGIGAPTGWLQADVQIHTRTSGQPMAEGQVNLQDIGLEVGPRRLRFTGWAGNLSLRGGTLIAHGLRGQVGRSDIELSGKLEHMLSYLGGNRPQLGLEINLKSQFLDLDELLLASQQPEKTVAAATQAGANQNYLLAVAPGLHLYAEVDIKQLRFRRFTPRAITGQLQVAQQQVDIDNFRFREAGGQFLVSGTLNAQPALMPTTCTYSLERVQVDSLFYVLEDFNQTTLRHTQLQGRLTTDGNASFLLNRGLEIQPASVVAAAKVKIVDGVLLYFEPAQALGRFIDKEELKQLRFSAIENTITIEGQTVTIPEMDIRSNLLRCYVSGTHTFAQDLDYHLRIPTHFFRKNSLTSVSQDAGGNLLLTLRGRVPNVKVGYDFAALKSKLTNTLQEEKENFKNLFKRNPPRLKQEQEQMPGPTPASKPEEQKPAEPAFLDLD